MQKCLKMMLMNPGYCTLPEHIVKLKTLSPIGWFVVATSLQCLIEIVLVNVAMLHLNNVFARITRVPGCQMFYQIQTESPGTLINGQCYSVLLDALFNERLPCYLHTLADPRFHAVIQVSPLNHVTE